MNTFTGLLLFLISTILALVVFAYFVRFVVAKKIESRIIIYAGPSIILGCLALVNGGVESLAAGDGRLGKVLLMAISLVVISFVSLAITGTFYKFTQQNRK